jgi:hypothetical protein
MVGGGEKTCAVASTATAEPNLAMATRAVDASAASRTTGADDGESYALERSDWSPEPGHLEEHYEIQRERERWKAKRAGEDIDPLGLPTAPTAWIALDPAKIFDILRDGEMATVWLALALEMGLISVVAFAIATGI